MATNDLQAMQNEVFGELKRNWGWMLALGIIMVILGTVGLGMTVLLNEVVVLYIGVLLLFGAGVQLVQAFRGQGWKGRLWHVLIALAYLVAGAITIYDPVKVGIILTLLIAWALVFIGGLRLVVAIQMRGNSGWVWVLLGGIASIVLGIMVMNQWPESGLWVIGLFVAIEMIFAGWSQIMIALAAKNYQPDNSSGSTSA